MKKIIGVALIGLILAACGDRDENYFFENQDKAKAHLKSCEEKLMNALENGDDKKYNEINNDAECVAADSALKKQRQLDWKKEQEQRQLELKKAQEERELQRKLAEEKKLQDIADAKALIIADHQDKSWEKRISEYLKNDCYNSWGNTTPECTAWKEFYEETVTEGKAQLTALDFADLKTKANEYCKLDQRSGSSCAVWQEALADKGSSELENADIYTIEARKEEFCSDDIRNLNVCNRSWGDAWRARNDELIKFYTDNDAEFITTYNQCTDRVQEVEAQGLKYGEKYRALEAIRDLAPCSQVANSYRNRGMGYSPFQVKIAE
ncbi:hypothetical protein [Ignatzschineria sp. LJL83]